MKFKITLGLLIVFNTVSAHSGDVIKIDKATIQASGGTTSSNSIQIKGGIGQSDASYYSSGGVYAVNGGIWSTTPVNNDIIFKNGFES